MNTLLSAANATPNDPIPTTPAAGQPRNAPTTPAADLAFSNPTFRPQPIPSTKSPEQDTAPWRRSTSSMSDPRSPVSNQPWRTDQPTPVAHIDPVYPHPVDDPRQAPTPGRQTVPSIQPSRNTDDCLSTKYQSFAPATIEAWAATDPIATCTNKYPSPHDRLNRPQGLGLPVITRTGSYLAGDIVSGLITPDRAYHYPARFQGNEDTFAKTLLPGAAWMKLNTDAWKSVSHLGPENHGRIREHIETHQNKAAPKPPGPTYNTCWLPLYHQRWHRAEDPRGFLPGEPIMWQETRTTPPPLPMAEATRKGLNQLKSLVEQPNLNRGLAGHLVAKNPVLQGLLGNPQPEVVERLRNLLAANEGVHHAFKTSQESPYNHGVVVCRTMMASDYATDADCTPPVDGDQKWEVLRTMSLASFHLDWCLTEWQPSETLDRNTVNNTWKLIKLLGTIWDPTVKHECSAANLITSAIKVGDNPESTEHDLNVAVLSVTPLMAQMRTVYLDFAKRTADEWKTTIRTATETDPAILREHGTSADPQPPTPSFDVPFGLSTEVTWGFMTLAPTSTRGDVHQTGILPKWAGHHDSVNFL